MSIINFSSKVFQLVELDNVNVEQLGNLAGSHGSNLFVLHDRTNHFSAVIIPELVTFLLEKLELPPDDLAAPTGLLDALRQGQLTVREDQPASRVARLALGRRIDLVIVVNPNAAPVGLFVPSRVAEHLPGSTRIRQSTMSLSKRVQEMRDVKELPDILKEIEEEHTDFASERLNQVVADPFVCAGDKDDGSHYVNSCPCSYHLGGSCSRRGVKGP